MKKRPQPSLPKFRAVLKAWRDSFGLCRCDGHCGESHKCRAMDNRWIIRLETCPSKFIEVDESMLEDYDFNEYLPPELVRISVVEASFGLIALCQQCKKGVNSLEQKRKDAERAAAKKAAAQPGLFDHS